MQRYEITLSHNAWGIVHRSIVSTMGTNDGALVDYINSQIRAWGYTVSGVSIVQL